MNISTKALPEGYAQSDEINLKKNKRLAIILNIIAVVVAIFSFYLLSGFTALMRPGLMNSSGSITLVMVVILVGLYVILMTMHELIHGFFFWVFTRSRPVFGIRQFYAFAGAPAWYIPTRQYAFVTLGPLIIIGVAGMLLMLIVPESWLLTIIFLVALNTGGAMGDFLVFTHLFKLPQTCLANDTGDVITFYEHALPLRMPGGERE
jgi:Putative zincin peptidase